MERLGHLFILYSFLSHLPKRNKSMFSGIVMQISSKVPIRNDLDQRLDENYKYNKNKCFLPSHIARTSDNLVVVIKSTARQVPSVTWEFSANSYISFPSF